MNWTTFKSETLGTWSIRIIMLTPSIFMQSSD
jgi:hypothetical protein